MMSSEPPRRRRHRGPSWRQTSHAVEWLFRVAIALSAHQILAESPTSSASSATSWTVAPSWETQELHDWVFSIDNEDQFSSQNATPSRAIGRLRISWPFPDITMDQQLGTSRNTTVPEMVDLYRQEVYPFNTDTWTGASLDGRYRLHLARRRRNDATILVGSWHAPGAVHWMGPHPQNPQRLVMHPPRDHRHEVSWNPSDVVAPSTSKQIQQPLKESALGKEPSHRERQLQSSSSPEIGILVPWSPTAECQVSGLPADCTLGDATETAMRALIDLCLQQTNTALRNSGVQASVFLAEAHRVDCFVDTSTTLTAQNLWNTNNGILDDLMERRQRYGGDVVLMIVGDTSPCGGAFENYPEPTIELTMGAVAWDCATRSYSFAHEFGHLMGCAHDRARKEECDVEDRTNYGYRDPRDRFRDIMATNCNFPESCEGALGDQPCDRQLLYSHIGDYTTPGGDNLGPIGDTRNNCAGQINAVAGIAASLYGGVTTSVPSQLATTPPPSIRPSVSPTPRPTWSPTGSPSVLPSYSPSILPTSSPSFDPTEKLTAEPSYAPSATPTGSPSSLPSSTPSFITSLPTVKGSAAPSLGPTRDPTLAPSSRTSAEGVQSSTPSSIPSLVPTEPTTLRPSADSISVSNEAPSSSSIDSSIAPASSASARGSGMLLSMTFVMAWFTVG